jgi:Late competence development protein ComFB
VLNALEEAVRATYESLRSSDATFCGCTRCRDDVMTLVLNQARPRYVVGDPLGSAVTRVALDRRQMRAELSVIVLDAMRRVAQAPHHSREVDRGSTH